ncbi:hypothetical protein B0H13DRAFT_1905244 [Mycena leptocephala]|nr:hypothetical protein B0H13DRAFT_1905244 [Mycena leptocephala]
MSDSDFSALINMMAVATRYRVPPVPETTEGFKRHMLEKEDEGQLMEIVIHRDSVEFKSSFESVRGKIGEGGTSGIAVRKDPITNVHPLVRIHPIIGTRCIFINGEFITDAEWNPISEFLLQRLIDTPVIDYVDDSEVPQPRHIFCLAAMAEKPIPVPTKYTLSLLDYTDSARLKVKYRLSGQDRLNTSKMMLKREACNRIRYSCYATARGAEGRMSRRAARGVRGGIEGDAGDGKRRLRSANTGGGSGHEGGLSLALRMRVVVTHDARRRATWWECAGDGRSGQGGDGSGVGRGEPRSRMLAVVWERANVCAGVVSRIGMQYGVGAGEERIGDVADAKRIRGGV